MKSPISSSAGNCERVEASSFARAVAKRSPRFTFALIPSASWSSPSPRARKARHQAWLSNGSREVWQGEIWRVFTYAFLQRQHHPPAWSTCWPCTAWAAFSRRWLGGRPTWRSTAASAVGGGVATALAGILREGPGRAAVAQRGRFRRHLGPDGCDACPRARPAAGTAPVIARGLRQRLLLAWSSTWPSRSCRHRPVRATLAAVWSASSWPAVAPASTGGLG